MSCCCTTLGLIAAAVGLLYLFLVWNFGYWKKRGIREAKSYPLLGTFPSSVTQKQHLSYDHNKVYRQFKNTENFVGVFNNRTPQLMILDPECVHKVFVNDFKNFHDNEFSRFVNEKDVLFGNNPFFLSGEKWKERRNEVSPGLTQNRIKNAYPVTLEVCKKLKNFIREQTKMSTKDGIDTNDIKLLAEALVDGSSKIHDPFSALKLCIRYTTEVVTDCVLGVKAQSFTNNPTPILPMIKRLFDFDWKFILYFIVAGLWPGIRKIYQVRLVNVDIEKFFCQLIEQATDLRRAQGNNRIDFLNYMLQIQDKKNLTTPEMTSNMMTFLTDGFVTTASAVAHCLLLLARNPKEQEKLRKEITENFTEDDEDNFNKLNELPFLDACFHETLRLFAPGQFSAKLCTAPIELTNKDGTTLKLNVNDSVLIPINSIHHDEQYYKNAEEFQPDRFLAENAGHKVYREKGLFLGFGDGPRVCLGMRFALVQGKAAIVEVVKNFNIKRNPKTRTDNALDPKDFLSGLLGGIWLDFEPLN